MNTSVWIKFTSGRFLLTIACAFVFAWTAVHELLPSEAVAAILSAVFTHYFTKERNINWRLDQASQERKQQ